MEWALLLDEESSLLFSVSVSVLLLPFFVLATLSTARHGPIVKPFAAPSM
jgi:hypothetical protein